MSRTHRCTCRQSRGPEQFPLNAHSSGRPGGLGQSVAPRKSGGCGRNRIVRNGRCRLDCGCSCVSRRDFPTGGRHSCRSCTPTGGRGGHREGSLLRNRRPQVCVAPREGGARGAKRAAKTSGIGSSDRNERRIWTRACSLREAHHHIDLRVRPLYRAGS